MSDTTISTETHRIQSPASQFPKLVKIIAYLDSLEDRADLETLRRFLEELDITREDLEAACGFCDDHYQRNIIKESEWYELVCICWKSGQRTPIHDHRGSSCAFKVIAGTAMEMCFDKTPSGLLKACDTHDAPAGFICASYDADIHQVLNAQPEGEDVVTLHIYSPPMRQYRKYSLDSPNCDCQCHEERFEIQ